MPDLLAKLSHFNEEVFGVQRIDHLNASPSDRFIVNRFQDSSVFKGYLLIPKERVFWRSGIFSLSFVYYLTSIKNGRYIDTRKEQKGREDSQPASLSPDGTHSSDRLI